MSSADRFAYLGSPIVGVLKQPPNAAVSFHDTVDVPTEDAVRLWWGLEDLSFVSTGTDSGTGQNINWTMTLGATESLAWVPDAGLANQARIGSYYGTSTNALANTPATPPRLRSGTFSARATGASPAVIARFQRYDSGTGSTLFFAFECSLLGEVSAGTTRVSYRIRIEDVRSNAVSIFNPAQGITGTPASSGSFTIAGITFNWVGGGRAPSGMWSGLYPTTLAVTSSLFAI